MSKQNARDLRYGRRGGGWSDAAGPLDGPPCEVCGAPMLGGQRRRHGVCSPRLECCGAYPDLAGDLAKHAAEHRELELERMEASPMTATACKWCRGPLPAGARRDSVYCGQRCRQAAHRFKVDASHRTDTGAPARPMRFAYADPPYPGLAHYYAEHPDFGGEVDHVALVAQLVAGGYDGWALSTSSRSLPYVLAICADAGADVRVAAWVRGPRGRARARRPLQAWEPVVYCGGRELGAVRTDVLVHAARPRRTDPGHVIGAKPAAFARFVFELLGAEPGDELDDLFPGSGGILRAWHVYASPRPGSDASAAAELDASAAGEIDASPAGRTDASGSAELDASLRDLGDGYSAAAGQ